MLILDLVLCLFMVNSIYILTYFQVENVYTVVTFFYTRLLITRIQGFSILNMKTIKKSITLLNSFIFHNFSAFQNTQYKLKHLTSFIIFSIKIYFNGRYCVQFFPKRRQIIKF